MHKPTVLLILAIFGCTSCDHQPDNNQAINPVIGDISFIQKFGTNPDRQTNETVRIKTHLEYVEQMLRQKDVSSLSKALQENRTQMLDLLHTYWTAGNFPKNYDHPGERKPCFIDRDGGICAVGYLVEQCAGRNLAETINTAYQYSYIGEMNLAALSDWVKNSGLTLAECAMIQPTYSSPTPDNYIPPAYGVASSVWSALNVSFITVNGIQIAKPVKSKWIPALGLVSGAGQLTYGALKFPEDKETINGLVTNEGQKVVSFVNIGFGTCAIFLSCYNLIAHRPKKVSTVAWNIYGYPAGNGLNVGFNFAKRF